MSSMLLFNNLILIDELGLSKPGSRKPGRSRTISQNRNFGFDLAQNRYFSVLSNHALNSILLTYFEPVFQ
jgi:hypothetical protein